MSAHRYTDYRIDCDDPDCKRSEFAGHLDLIDATAAAARKILKARGWQVAVTGEDRMRRDFCPSHARTLRGGQL